MTFTVTDYDNMKREYTFQDDGKVIIKSSQDLEGHLKYCEEKRNNESKTGKSHDLKHYASIPVVIAEELIKKGIDIFDKNCVGDLKREIDTNYPHLKTTNYKGW